MISPASSSANSSAATASAAAYASSPRAFASSAASLARFLMAMTLSRAYRMNMRVAAECPAIAAMCMGVKPASVRSVESTPLAERSASTTAVDPPSAAR